jgi:hypothetical protein
VTSYKFNTSPSDQPCEICDATGNVLYCDSDFGPLSVSLCPSHIDADYNPNAD